MHDTVYLNYCIQDAKIKPLRRIVDNCGPEASTSLKFNNA